MNKHQAVARVEAICDELRSPNISDARVKQLGAELDRIQAQTRTKQAAIPMGAYASPEEFGMADTNPGEFGSGISFKGFAPTRSAVSGRCRCMRWTASKPRL